MSSDTLRLDEPLARWETQLRKGVLELVILLALTQREQYGFELITGIAKRSGLELSEGTVYPLLLRMAKDGMIQSRFAEGEGGAPRKYYSTTAHGGRMLDAMRLGWSRLVASVEALSLTDAES